MSQRLLITSTDLMMVQFLVPHVKHLSQKGFVIDLACSEVGGRFDEVKNILGSFVSNIFHLDLQRSPLSPNNYSGYKQLCKIFDENHYDLVWTNEPVMSVATRLAARKARKKGMKVLYMAHGFHFFNGAPTLNWALFYPIEKIMAHHADVIVCVNHEDFKRAKSFAVPRVEYIHGIGINTERLTQNSVDKKSIRKELGLKETDFIVLSVGELNRNKNQATILKALAKLNNPEIHYILCGKGYEEENLKGLAKQLDIEKNVHFLGYRRDVVDICSESDVYAMPSFREGLPVSSLEAMYCGLPLVTSNIRGLVDVNHEGVNGYLCSPTDIDAFASNIKLLFENPDMRTKMGMQNQSDVIPFTVSNTLKEIHEILKLS